MGKWIRSWLRAWLEIVSVDVLSETMARLIDVKVLPTLNAANAQIADFSEARETDLNDYDRRLAQLEAENQTLRDRLLVLERRVEDSKVVKVSGVSNLRRVIAQQGGLKDSLQEVG